MLENLKNWNVLHLTMEPSLGESTRGGGGAMLENWGPYPKITQKLQIHVL